MEDLVGAKLSPSPKTQLAFQNNCSRLDNEHDPTGPTAVSSSVSATGISSSTVPVILWGMQNLVDSEADLISPECDHSSPDGRVPVEHHQAGRRRRRKQIAPPQKFPACSTPSNDCLSVPDDSDDENESIRTASNLTESDEEDKTEFIRAQKRSRNEAEEEESSIAPSIQYGALIDEISRQTMDAVKHYIIPTSVCTCDNDKDRVDEVNVAGLDETNQIVERAMQHLEPQIARLVGQSIRHSIRTIRAQMLTGPRQDGVGSEANKAKSGRRDDVLSTKLSADSTVNKDSSGFTISNLSGDLKTGNLQTSRISPPGMIRMKQQELSTRGSPNTGDGGNGDTDSIKTSPEDLSSSLLSKPQVEDNRTSVSNRTYPVTVPPLQVVNHWKIGTSQNPSINDSSCLTTLPVAGFKSETTIPTSSVCPLINCCRKNQAKSADRTSETILNPTDQEGARFACRSGSDDLLKSKNTHPDTTGIEFSNILESFNGTESKTQKVMVHCNEQRPGYQNSSWKPSISTTQPGVTSAAAAAAILTAFGLTNNPFWATRRPASNDRNLPSWIPAYSPTLLQWASENLATAGSEPTNSTNSHPLANASPFTMIPPLPGLVNTNMMDLASSVPNSANPVNLSTEEQTEALPLVVRGLRSDLVNNTVARFSRDELSSIASENQTGSIPVVSTGYTQPMAMNYQGGLLSRRKRTKVTDTRMGSRGPRAMHCTSPRTNSSLNANSCSGFPFFKSLEDKNVTLKMTNNVIRHPVSTASSLSRNLKSENSERPLGDMIPSPTNLTEARLNSSSSSPSPNSVRLSGGSHDQVEGESGRLLSNRANISTGFYPPAQIQNVQTALRHGIGSIASLMNKERHSISEGDTFEQVLAQSFHPYSFSKRPSDTNHGKSSSFQMTTMFDPTMTSASSPQMLEPGYQNSHASSLLMNHDLRNNSIPSLTRNVSLDLPGIRAPLVSFGKPNNHSDGLFKRGLHASLLLPGSCCDSDSLTDNPNGSTCLDGMRVTSTLTPVHLRKAKLMFFYTRYPNSTLIKMYFPDVKFYKNNTAQLVKWFSNFREFYYIQMEKFARVAISEGIRSAEEIHVTTDSELYRALNLHYNRNQQLEVPHHFRVVVEATLREFFNALMTGKDAEQSWKKPIYKIIARMDQPVPEFFKNPNWMEQLADG